jgi:uncharacterized protein (DUF488 family)
MPGVERRLVTVGHGTLGPEELGSLLAGAGVDLVVDVRRFPGSRRHPHVARDRLAEWLPDHGVAYRWEERLGGRRKPDPDSPHVALRNTSFRAYADHTRTDEFADALADVLAAASAGTVAVMCSESVWWRCHRRLVADAVVLLHDTPVLHLMHDGKLRPHAPTDGVRVEGDHLVYDVGVDRPLLDGG